MVGFISIHYAELGRDACAAAMGLTTAQVRQKASRLQLKARGVSAAWHRQQDRHSSLLTGRKRPDQSIVMKAMHANGQFKNRASPESISVRQKKWIAENGHPRGALGMKHSAETKAAIAMKSREQWAGMTQERIMERTVKMMKTRSTNGTYANHRPNTTWKAAWRIIGGIRKFFRSKWEANYAHYLQWLKENKQIADWKHEPKTFWFEGVKRGCVSYLPDFCVTELSGAESYHEVKGWMDARSKTKIKRMAKYHPTVKLIVIDAKGYAALKKKCEVLVPGWEA